MKKTLTLILTGGLLMGLFSGCIFGARYHVDYDGMKSAFDGARDSYRAGAKVSIAYKYVATDTNYYFYLDGEEIQPEYDSNRRFVLEFEMPSHDATVTVRAINTMTEHPTESRYDPVYIKQAYLEYTSFDGSGIEFSFVADDPSIVSVEEKKVYRNANHDFVTGSRYDLYLTLRGLKPGQTVFRASGNAPTGGNFDEVYDVYVNDELRIAIQKRK